MVVCWRWSQKIWIFEIYTKPFKTPCWLEWWAINVFIASLETCFFLEIQSNKNKHWIQLKAIFKVRRVQNFLSGSVIPNEVLVWSNQLSYFQRAFRPLEIHTLPSFLLLWPWFFLLWSCRKHKLIAEINHSWTDFLNTLFHQPAHEIISPTEYCLRYNKYSVYFTVFNFYTSQQTWLTSASLSKKVSLFEHGHTIFSRRSLEVQSIRKCSSSNETENSLIPSLQGQLRVQNW